jgi:hypothetical protein
LRSVDYDHAAENKDKAEQKVSKDELSEKEIDKVSGGSVTIDKRGLTVGLTGLSKSK